MGLHCFRSSNYYFSVDMLVVKNKQETPWLDSIKCSAINKVGLGADGSLK